MATQVTFQFPMPGFEGNTEVFAYDGKALPNPAKLVFTPAANRRGSQPVLYIELVDPAQPTATPRRAILTLNSKTGKFSLQNLADEDDDAQKAKTDGAGAGVSKRKEAPPAPPPGS